MSTIKSSSENLTLNADGAGRDVVIQNNGTETVRVDGSGNVGIGTTTPSSSIHVYGTTTSGGIFVEDSSTSSTSPAVVVTGKRVDGNGSQAFSGKLLLSKNQTNAATDSAGDALGTIMFGGNHTDGSISNILYAASISGISDGAFNSSTDMPTAIAFYTGSTGRNGDTPNVSSGAERMRIDSSGSLLVGTTSVPNVGAGNTGFSVSANQLVFSSNTNGGNSISYWRTQSGNSYVASYWNGNNNVGSISVTTTATSYNTSSDYRLKEDWQPMSDSIARVKSLNPVNFAWKVDGTRVDGFLAHEAQKVVPESVSGDKDAMKIEEYEVTPEVRETITTPAVEAVEATYDDEGNVLTEAIEAQEERTEERIVTEAVMGEREVPNYQGIDQSKLVPLLTSALQEAVAKIEDLEKRIEILEA